MQPDQTDRINGADGSGLACGVDIVDIGHFARVLNVGGKYFLRRVYTESELLFCAERIPQLAGRFAAKEAISKALGTGLCGIHWCEMEILSDQYGCPYVSLYGRAAARAEQMKLAVWTISLSHSPMLAIAFVVASHPQRLPNG